MPSPPLFPAVSASEALGIAQSTPFLELEWLFGFYPHPVLQQLEELRATRTRRVTFEKFKEEKEIQRSTLSKSFRAALEEENDEVLEDLLAHSDYLVELGPRSLPSSRFVEHYQKLSALAAHDRGRLSESAFHLALLPALAWHRTEKLGAASRLAALKHLEALIREVQRHSTGTRCSNIALDALNRLTFAYFMAASTLGLGVSPAILCGHALIFRQCQTHDWSNLSEMVRMRFACLTLHLTRQFFDFDQPFEAQLGFSHNTLADLRAIFRTAASGTAGSGLRSHQWAYRWLADKLDSEVFSTRNNRVAWDHLSVLSESEQLAIVELARRFSSYRVPVTVDRVAAFILQFGTTSRIRAALRMLTHVKFFPLWELSAAMETVLAKEAAFNKRKRLIVVPLGDQSGSTAIIRYLAAHSSLKNLVFKDDIKSALDSTRAGDTLYFIDDCLLSGTQALSILGDWMGTRKRKSHHTIYSKPLDQTRRKKLLQRNLVFAYCIATDIGQTRFFRELLRKTGLKRKQVRVAFGVLEPDSSKAFEALGPVGWASAEERQTLKSFASEVGHDILRDRAAHKGWDEHRRRESSLGFSDFQRLLVFPYNVPKTTLTLLWQTGNDERPWQPLFPGYD